MNDLCLSTLMSSSESLYHMAYAQMTFCQSSRLCGDAATFKPGDSNILSRCERGRLKSEPSSFAEQLKCPDRDRLSIVIETGQLEWPILKEIKSVPSKSLSVPFLFQGSSNDPKGPFRA